MPEIHAFRGLRYDLGHVGSLSDVVAPPYDVIDASLQKMLYQRHPANVIRLILNRQEPGDASSDDRYARSARLLRNWISEGILQTDPDPAIYVYHQEFAFGGEQLTRRGFMGRVRLQRFGEGSIYPHEETHAAAKADRFKLTVACQANLSQIFGLYPDESNEAQERLETAVARAAPLEATDHLGVVHRLWPVTDVKAVAEVAAIMGPKPIFVADGHHRYETACNYRDHLAAGRTLDANHPANFVLMMCVSMSDAGMIVLPTHRLFRGIEPLDSQQLGAKLQGCFRTEIAGEGAAAGHVVWARIAETGDQGTLALFAPVDQRWVLLRISAEGRRRMAEVAADQSSDWRSLGVGILHRLVVESLLGAANLPKPKYVHEVAEVVSSLESGDEDGSPFALAALVMPATVRHVQAISQHGERMPAKSTYFYPKLVSGLVINPLT
ncbi:MAG: DUF1015 domain-containing protein [Planctomycetes bacterium]|nr:DUF1015 domain-containing protein [Planctomycetota bacterium]